MVIMSEQMGNLRREKETFFKTAGDLEQKSTISEMDNSLFEMQRDA